jgi:hypothetical protein
MKDDLLHILAIFDFVTFSHVKLKYNNFKRVSMEAALPAENEILNISFQHNQLIASSIILTRTCALVHFEISI